jgi:SAM-dependent methyltransferase
VTDRRSANIGPPTVSGFGEEWSAFDQSQLKGSEYRRLFDAYFAIFPFDALPSGSEGFDLGCGSGRWVRGVAPRVGTLSCNPSFGAGAGSRAPKAGNLSNVRFHLAASDAIPLADGSQDFGYSLGVFHHIPDTGKALADCVRKLKPGAPFLVYLYSKLDGRPAWFRALWRATDTVRKEFSRMPIRARKGVTSVMAAFVYWPLTQSALLLERLGKDTRNFPLHDYRRTSF